MATVGGVLTTIVRRGLALGLAVVVLSAACGDDGDDTAADEGSSDETTTTTSSEPTTTSTIGPTTTTAPPGGGGGGGNGGGGGGGGGGDGAVAISLDVQVLDSAGGQALRSGSLSCGDGGASGTGFFADPARAQAACTVLREDTEARRRLLEGPEPGLLCIEVYGGPEVATVRGEIDGLPVDATFDRTNGCGISDWDMLGSLFGPADT
jgi:hypothetical protein